MLTCVRAALLQVARVLASPLERERALGMQILSMILHLTEKESAQLASGLQVPTRARIPGGGPSRWVSVAGTTVALAL